MLAFLAVAFLQLAALTFEQLRETVEAIKTALTTQYVEAAEGARLAGLLGDAIEVWTRDEVPSARLPHVPVYVVTSADTFSAGEAFAFALQKTGRAVIVGERTGGGGYSGNFARLPHGFTMFVSAGRTFDPRTGKGWQVEGVHPDRAAPAAEAFDVALRLAAGAK